MVDLIGQKEWLKAFQVEGLVMKFIAEICV
jgi:hypothetical protein